VPQSSQTPGGEQPDNPQPVLDLDAIVARALHVARQYVLPDEADQDDFDQLTDFDVPLLVAEVRAGRIALEKARAEIANHQPVLAALAKARERIAELENALAATGRSLSSFIFDADDPGADALGAQWLYHQAMPQADDPFAQPRAFRSSVFTEASKAVEGMEGRPSDGEYSREYLNGYSHGLEDAAERLELLADQAVEGSEVQS